MKFSKNKYFNTKAQSLIEFLLVLTPLILFVAGMVQVYDYQMARQNTKMATMSLARSKFVVANYNQYESNKDKIKETYFPKDKASVTIDSATVEALPTGTNTVLSTLSTIVFLIINFTDHSAFDGIGLTVKYKNTFYGLIPFGGKEWQITEKVVLLTSWTQKPGAVAETTMDAGTLIMGKINKATSLIKKAEDWVLNLFGVREFTPPKESSEAYKGAISDAINSLLADGKEFGGKKLSLEQKEAIQAFTRKEMKNVEDLVVFSGDINKKIRSIIVDNLFSKAIEGKKLSDEKIKELRDNVDGEIKNLAKDEAISKFEKETELLIQKVIKDEAKVFGP